MTFNYKSTDLFMFVPFSILRSLLFSDSMWWKIWDIMGLQKHCCLTLHPSGTECAVAPEKSWLWPSTVPVFGGQGFHVSASFHSIHICFCLWSVHGSDQKSLKEACLLANDLLLFPNRVIKSGFEGNITTKIHLSFQWNSQE